MWQRLAGGRKRKKEKSGEERQNVAQKYAESELCRMAEQSKGASSVDSASESFTLGENDADRNINP